MKTPLLDYAKPILSTPERKTGTRHSCHLCETPVSPAAQYCSCGPAHLRCVQEKRKNKALHDSDTDLADKQKSAIWVCHKCHDPFSLEFSKSEARLENLVYLSSCILMFVVIIVISAVVSLGLSWTTRMIDKQYAAEADEELAKESRDRVAWMGAIAEFVLVGLYLISIPIRGKGAAEYQASYCHTMVDETTPIPISIPV
jgi:hypothetical protein